MFAIPVWGAKAVSIDLHTNPQGANPAVFADLLHHIRGTPRETKATHFDVGASLLLF